MSAAVIPHTADSFAPRNVLTVNSLCKMLALKPGQPNHADLYYAAE